MTLADVLKVVEGNTNVRIYDEKKLDVIFDGKAHEAWEGQFLGDTLYTLEAETLNRSVSEMRIDVFRCLVIEIW